MKSNGVLVLAILVTGWTTLSVAGAADVTGCTPQERSNQTLSEKIDQTKGVICPPDVDPGIKVPTPNAGKTPIIPPADTPGSNPKALQK